MFATCIDSRHSAFYILRDEYDTNSTYLEKNILHEICIKVATNGRTQTSIMHIFVNEFDELYISVILIDEFLMETLGVCSDRGNMFSQLEPNVASDRKMF